MFHFYSEIIEHGGYIFTKEVLLYKNNYNIKLTNNIFTKDVLLYNNNYNIYKIYIK